jgi:hypothetical protein
VKVIMNKYRSFEHKKTTRYEWFYLIYYIECIYPKDTLLKSETDTSPYVAI